MTNIADLLDRSHNELLALAPSATHQHTKGGLYRFMGPAMDVETKQILVDSEGNPLDAWEHVYPFERAIWIRKHSESDRFAPLRSLEPLPVWKHFCPDNGYTPPAPDQLVEGWCVVT